MIIRRADEVKGTEQHVHGATGTWDSMRYLTARDGVGFSFHITTLYAGKSIPLWYKNHVEAVYVISGRLGILWDHIQDTWDPERPNEELLRPGDMYLLDKNDRHELHPLTDVTVACVFNPAVNGDEDHDEDGSYAAPESGMVSVDRQYLQWLRTGHGHGIETVTTAYLRYLEERSEKLGIYEDQYGELAE